MTLDLSILEKAPELTKEIILEIEPLAPLSMVSELPGSYYKTLKSPSKKIPTIPPEKIAYNVNTIPKTPSDPAVI